MPFPAALGDWLEAVTGTYNVFTDGTETPTDYFFLFASAGSVRAATASDGQTLKLEVGATPEAGFDMGQYGRVVVRSVGGDPPFNRVLGKQLTGTDAIL